MVIVNPEYIMAEEKQPVGTKLFDGFLLIAIPILCYLALRDPITFLLMATLAAVHLYIGYQRYCHQNEIHWTTCDEILTIGATFLLLQRCYEVNDILFRLVFSSVAVFILSGHTCKLIYPDKPYYCCCKSAGPSVPTGINSLV